MALWIDTLRVLFGGKPDDAAAFDTISGGRALPGKRMKELWAVVGRRSGKSRMAAAISVYIALFQKHKLSAGEVGTVLVLAPSTAQSRIVFRYCLGFIEQSPVLAQELASTTAHEIRLRSGIVIAVHSSSFRTVRGRTLLACIFDEVAFWRDESSAIPDVEAYRAVVPSLATSNGILIGISSPYRKTGLLAAKHKKYFGTDDPDTLVVQGATQLLNPTIATSIIDAARADDPESARAEWDADFRSDIAALFDDDLIDRAVDPDRPLELPPRPSFKYVAFCDASGGRHDHYTVSVAHKQPDGGVIVDLVRGQAPPFDPQNVTRTFAALVKGYGLRAITGDNYAAGWVETAWRAEGVVFERSKLSRSELYLEAIPLFTRELISLPNHPRLLRELRLLERRTSRVGKDIVDHGRNGSDDYANAVVGAANVSSVVIPRAHEFLHMRGMF